MKYAPLTRQILPDSKSFKTFWQNSGPYLYALTSREYPPVLLAEEEWIFANDIKALLKELMQFDSNKMKFVVQDFNDGNTQILRPKTLSPWKILHFPEAWNLMVCDFFIPEGHLTHSVIEEIEKKGLNVDSTTVETAFFECLETNIEKLGYSLFKPGKGGKRASVQAYLKEWEEDDADAGMI